ncbi:hypothetical protein HDU76_001159 [Blyttiomyces sp. JEL0837]|nr:hypothetical protein HDU76_001159 [Blyttiomyces sp. JEL0837]
MHRQRFHLFLLIALIIIANVAHAVTSKKVLILSKAGEETVATSVLVANNVPYDVVYVDANGPTAPFPLLDDTTPTNTVYTSLNGTTLTRIYTYLSIYGGRLVKLGDAPDAALGVTAIGSGADNGQNIIFANGTLAILANQAPNAKFSTTALFHYPSRISNSTIASPAMYFDVGPAPYNNKTVAAAVIKHPKGFMQLSFYLPFASWSSTSMSLGPVWLSWGQQISLFKTFTYDQRVLVLSKAEQLNISTIILQGYGIPYDVQIATTAGVPAFTLEKTPGHGLYSLIVMTSPLAYANATGQFISVLTAAQRKQLYDYQSSYSVRMVVLNDVPDSTNGVAAIAPSGEDHVIIVADPDPIVNAGLQPSMALNTTGLYHYPSKILDTAMAKPILYFHQLGAAWPNLTVAAAAITIGTRQQLSFYVASAWWSTTSMILSHIWVAWGTRGVYQGHRRIAWSTHVDDLFLLSTVGGDGGISGPKPPAGTGVDFRLSVKDMDGIYKWQVDYNKRLNPGSSFKLDLCFNGNGILEYSNLKNPSLPAPLDHADTDVPYNFVKPLGTGYTYWPSTATALAPFQLASFQKNFAAMKQYDPLFAYFVANASYFYLNHHTFSHENLNNCSYSDAFHEIQSNYWMAVTAGWVGQPYWSNHSMVTPSISGLFNGDALKALWDFGIRSIQGDITRVNTLNDTNYYWPMVTSVATSNFGGMTVLPRSATRVYYNCSTTQENVLLHNALYPGQGATMKSILQQEIDRVVYKLFALHQDAYMFHQANLRNADLTAVNGTVLPDTTALRYLAAYPGGGTKAYRGGTLGLLQAWAESITAAYNQYTTWPMVTYKVDELESRAQARVTRETAGVVVTLVNASRFGFNTLQVSTVKPCVAGVSFPKGVTSSWFVTPGATWVYEQLGSDPLTVWVPLNAGETVTMKLKANVPFS